MGLAREQLVEEVNVPRDRTPDFPFETLRIPIVKDNIHPFCRKIIFIF